VRNTASIFRLCLVLSTGPYVLNNSFESYFELHTSLPGSLKKMIINAYDCQIHTQIAALNSFVTSIVL
jgi:hypothetical protein